MRDLESFLGHELVARETAESHGCIRWKEWTSLEQGFHCSCLDQMPMVPVYVRRSELTVLVYLRPCGIGGRVGLMLEPGLVIGAAEYLLYWAGALSCRKDGMCRTGKHQEKRSCMPLVPWYTKKISLEFLNHKRSATNTILRLSRSPDISCTQLDRINLCRFAQ